MMQPCECPYRAANGVCVPISPESVRDALNNLVYSATPHPPSPLIYLTLVDEAIAQSDWPCSPQSREFALASLLIDLITNLFAAHCCCFQLPEPETWTTQSDALLAIRAQAQTESIELVGWGWLYTHFVRVELAISPQLFGQAAGIDLRTLRRYQQHTIARLMLYLIHHERDARRRSIVQ